MDISKKELKCRIYEKLINQKEKKIVKQNGKILEIQFRNIISNSLPPITRGLGHRGMGYLLWPAAPGLGLRGVGYLLRPAALGLGLGAWGISSGLSGSNS